MFEESMSIPGIWASMNSWFTPTVLFILLNVMIGTIAVTSGLGAQKHPNQQQQQQQHENQDEKNREDSHQQQQQQHHHHQHQQQQQQQQEVELNRSPSVLQRLKSINFYAYSYRSQEPISIPTPETHTHEIDYRNHQPEQPHEEEEEEEEEEGHTHELEHPQEEGEEEEQTYEQEQDIGEGEKTMEEVYCQLQRSHNRTKSETMPASGEVLVKLPKKMRKSASVKSAFSHFEEDDIVESRRPATVREGKAKVTAEVDDGEDDDDEEVDAKADDFINRFKQQLKLQRLDSIVRYKEMVNRGSGK